MTTWFSVALRTYEDQLCASLQCREECSCEGDVQHGCFVDEDGVGFQGVVTVEGVASLQIFLLIHQARVFPGTACRDVLEQPVDGG